MLGTFPKTPYICSHKKRVEEYSQIEETISPEVLQDMAEWIKALSL